MTDSSATQIQRPAPLRNEARTRLSPALLNRRVRDVHLYLGMLFAPSLLFFAATGALQLYNLHEVRPGRSFQPPALLQELGMVHKNQVFEIPHRHGPRPPEPEKNANVPSASPDAAPLRPQTGWTVLALKAFFLLAALGLIVSTSLGIWLGLKSGRHRGGAIAMLVAGIVVPVLLLAL